MFKKLSFVVLLALKINISKSQELEPRAYANLPVRTNAFAAFYGFSTGNVLTDPSKPILGAKMNSHNIGLSYVNTFGLFKKLARLQFNLPYAFIADKASFNGRDTSGKHQGFGDLRIRFGINLWGSEALTENAFKHYEQKTIAGFSMIISAPTGNYHKNNLINLGSNRWAFKPEFGISQRFRRFYGEVYAGVWFYTDNNAFLSNKVHSQETVFSLQTHLSYYFRNHAWIGLNGNWFNGGKTFIDDQPAGDLEDNWRVGATFSMPLASQHSLRLQFHVGAFTSTGYDYNIISLTYQFIFIGRTRSEK